MYFYHLVKIQALGFHALGNGNWMFGDSWGCVFFGATVSAAALFCSTRKEAVCSIFLDVFTDVIIMKGKVYEQE